MNELEGVLMAILSATAGARKPTERERRNVTETLRKYAVEEGLSELDAVRISVRFATASAEFADACVTANQKAHALMAAMRELGALAEKLADNRTGNGGDES